MANSKNLIFQNLGKEAVRTNLHTTLGTVVLQNFLNVTLISLVPILPTYLQILSHRFLIYCADFSGVPPNMKYHTRKNQISNLFLLFHL